MGTFKAYCRPTAVAILYVGLCTIAPMLYGHPIPIKAFAWDLSVVWQWDHFVCNNIILLGWFIGPLIAFIEDRYIRRQFAILFLCDAALQLGRLWIEGTEYAPLEMTINNIFYAASFLYILFKASNNGKLFTRPRKSV